MPSARPPFVAPLVVLAVACSGPSKDTDPTQTGTTDQTTPPTPTADSDTGSPTVDTTPTATTAVTGTTGTTGHTGTFTGVPATLTPGPDVVCADPGQRLVRPFDLKQSSPIMPMLPEEAGLAGGGVVVADLDSDGHMDLLMVGVRADDDQLWWGTGGELFDEQGRAAFAGIDLTEAVGGSAADYDADGDLDLYITRYQLPDRLLRNNGDRTFTDVTDTAGMAGHTSAPPLPPLKKDPTRWAERRLSSQSASWADIDADGDLDLFVGTYGERTVLDVTEPQANCEDHLADPSELWRNNGDGTFTDIADLLPHDTHDGYLFASGWYDLDADGFPELVTAADDGYCAPSQVLYNNAGTAFTQEIFREDFDMGMGVGDLNGDELPDFLFTTWNGVTLWRSVPGLGTGPTGVDYVDATGAYGMTVAGPDRTNPGSARNGDQVYGWGAELGDIDNDTDLDAVMLFGYWSFYDGAGDPLWQNDGLWEQYAGTFTDVAPTMGLSDRGVGRGVVLADLNGDGWLDIVKRHLNEPTAMYMSNCGAESWVTIDLRAPDTANTYAIGAMVRVTTSTGSQVRWVQSGSSSIYSGGPVSAHFGLGDASDARIDVIWPDGDVSTFPQVEVRRHVTITRD